MARSRRTYSISQLPAVELFFKTATVALRTISFPATVDAGYECVPIYTLLLRPGLWHPLQGITVQALSLFEVYAICYGPGDWVNMISSKEAKSGGLAWSYTSNLCEGPSDRATHKEEC